LFLISGLIRLQHLFQAVNAHDQLLAIDAKRINSVENCYEVWRYAAILMAFYIYVYANRFFLLFVEIQLRIFLCGAAVVYNNFISIQFEFLA
jgi:hypothetical protein